MNYELAKQLKDAGFPVVEIHESNLIRLRSEQGIADYKDTGQDIFIIEDRYFLVPTLSEPIEACGEEFTTLTRYTNIKNIKLWGAWCHRRRIDQVGSTPEEAVSMLYLALNKK